jgi:very-short-patch-repair endonuclease
VRDASDPDILARTQGLIDYIRYFAVSRQDPVREFAGYKSVILLADLPNAVIRSKTADDGVILTVQYLPPRPHPAIPDSLRGWIDEHAAVDFSGAVPELASAGPAQTVVRAYQDWLGEWQEWAAGERTAKEHRDLHKKLHDMARRIDQDGDVYEAVFAAGLLTRALPRHRLLSRHVLTRRLSILVDDDTIGITVVLDDSAPCKLEDQEFLDAEDGYAAERSTPARGKLAGRDLHPLDDVTWSLLHDWAARSFDHAVRSDAGWRMPSPAAGALSLTLTPTIIVRERSGGAVGRYYDEIMAGLRGPGALVPLGLAQLAAPLTHEERLAWNSGSASTSGPVDSSADEPLLPLPTNEAQRQILDRMRLDTAVVVQGPPGTGKTHTIANLICSLLADGKRVLVTSEKEEALRELGDKLPTALRDLCVTVIGARRGEADDFERSITALSERLGSIDPARMKRDTLYLDAHRKDLLAEEKQLYCDITKSRKTEWDKNAEVAPGYVGTLADIASRVASLSPRFEWLYALDPGFAATDDGPPLDAGKALELLKLLVRATESRQARQSQLVPSPASIPATAAFRPIAAAVHQADDLAARASGTGRALADLDEDTLAAIEEHADAAAEAVHRLKMPQRMTAWRPDNWQARLLLARLENPERTEWHDTETAAAEVEEARRLLSEIGPRQVTMPGLSPGEMIAMIRSAGGLRRYLMSGGRLRRILPPSREQRDARLLLSSCLIDGRPPSNVHDVAAAAAWLTAQATADAHARRWGQAGFSAGSGQPVPDQLDRLASFYARLRQLNAIAAAHDSVDAILTQRRVWLPGMATLAGWDSLREGIPAARVLAGAGQHRAALGAFIASLPPLGPLAPTELVDLHHAATTADVDGYARALSALAPAYRDWCDQQRSDVLLGWLRQRHPRLAEELAATADDPVWEERLRFLPEAWAWLIAKAFCEKKLTYGSERDLQRRLDETQQRLAAGTERLAAVRAWGHLLGRITQPQRQALAAYHFAMDRLGKGTGQSALGNRRAARSAMNDARDTVPVWIMPIRRVAETIPPQQDAFDVVIIDEASQAGLEAAFLLWLAPTVIAVGDDKQCAPGNPGQKNQTYLDQLSACLPTLTEHERNAFGPDSNLYALLSQRFPNPVRLIEHFRSMPEIIGWSSRLFYRESLVPLRQFGADRLRPLQLVQVEDGRAEGHAQSFRNDAEARRLVATLRELLNDPAYLKDPVHPNRATTFAIIALHGDRHLQHIQNLQRLVDQSISSEVISRHGIRVGAPPDFQGAEFDVVLLSMVVSGRPKAATGRREQRRLNVAASRARDQMWLFTSVRPTDLSEKDLRRSLLDYMETYARNPPSYLGHSPAADEVSPDDPQDPFDSVIEQRVFRAIRQRGYHVIPQFEVGDYHIDLVVSGSNGRLAVECDGPIARASPDRIRADLSQERELRRAGWKFWRIRGSEFALDPEQALVPLWTALDDRGILPHTATETIATAAAPWSPINLRVEEDDEEGQDDPAE